MKVRQSTAAHNDDFMERVWPDYDRPLGIVWDEYRGHIRVEDEDGTTVGIANYLVVGGLGELQQILVRVDHSRRGIGSRLLRAFEDDCWSRGCHKLRLETAEYQARGFYESHGWYVAATLADDRFGQAQYVMEKKPVR